MDITIDPAIQSTFTQLGAYCVGDTPGALLGTSLEGITGTWLPATISTALAGTSTYTFTFDAGQCALGTTMDVEIIAPTIPTFTQIAPVCINSAAPTLPGTSDNGITGTWSPAINKYSCSGNKYLYIYSRCRFMCNNNDNGHHHRSSDTIDLHSAWFVLCWRHPDVLLGTSIEGINGTWSPAQ